MSYYDSGKIIQMYMNLLHFSLPYDLILLFEPYNMRQCPLDGLFDLLLVL